MALSLAATGYFIYLVEPWTPDAVVVSVVVFNAAFGYRYDHIAYISHRQAVSYVTAGVRFLGCTRQRRVTLFVVCYPSKVDRFFPHR